MKLIFDVLLRDHLVKKYNYSELQGASISESKQAINLAIKRQPWWINDVYFYKGIIPQLVLFAILVYLVLNIAMSSTFTFLLLFGVFFILRKVYLDPLLMEQIRPHLKCALKDVRLCKYR